MMPGIAARGELEFLGVLIGAGRITGGLVRRLNGSEQRHIKLAGERRQQEKDLAWPIEHFPFIPVHGRTT